MGSNLLDKDGKNFLDQIEKWIDDYMNQDADGYPPASLSDMTTLAEVDSVTVTEIKDYLMAYAADIDTGTGAHKIIIASKDRFRVKKWTGSIWEYMYDGLAGDYLFGPSPEGGETSAPEIYQINSIAIMMVQGGSLPGTPYINPIDITTVPIGNSSMKQPKGAYFDASDYYEISNEADFLAMNEKGCYKLMNDVTITDQGIDTGEVFLLNFSGILEGNGHTLTINQTDLFEKIERATLRNMKLVLNTDNHNSRGKNAGLTNELINSYFYDMEIEINITPTFTDSEFSGIAVEPKHYEQVMMGTTMLMPGRNWFEKCKFITNIENDSIKYLGVISSVTDAYVVNIVDCKWEGNINNIGSSDMAISMLGMVIYNEAKAFFANASGVGGGLS